MGKVEAMRAQQARRVAEMERAARKAARPTPVAAPVRPTQGAPIPTPAISPMAYKKAREAVGGRVEVAQRLGVHPRTLAAREQGRMKITQEAWVAISNLRPNTKS